jgi:hypothetical protein
MAKIIEDIVVVKFSKLVRDNTPKTTSLIDNDTRQKIESAVQSIIGDVMVVEIEQK